MYWVGRKPECVTKTETGHWKLYGDDPHEAENFSSNPGSRTGRWDYCFDATAIRVRPVRPRCGFCFSRSSRISARTVCERRDWRASTHLRSLVFVRRLSLLERNSAQ